MPGLPCHRSLNSVRALPIEAVRPVALSLCCGLPLKICDDDATEILTNSFSFALCSLLSMHRALDSELYFGLVSIVRNIHHLC